MNNPLTMISHDTLALYLTKVRSYIYYLALVYILYILCVVYICCIYSYIYCVLKRIEITLSLFSLLSFFLCYFLSFFSFSFLFCVYNLACQSILSIIPGHKKRTASLPLLVLYRVACYDFSNGSNSSII